MPERIHAPVVTEESAMTKLQKGIIRAGLILFSAGFAFVSYLLEYGAVKILRYYVLGIMLAYLAGVDIEKRIVPNRSLMLLLALRIVLFVPEALLYPGYLGSFLLSSFAGAICGMSILFLGNLICRNGMGAGDIKLFGVIGFYVGPDAALAVMLGALFFAAIYSAAKLAVRKIRLKDEIPFVPFVFAGFLVTALLGV